MSFFELWWRKLHCHPRSDTKCRIYKQGNTNTRGGMNSVYKLLKINYLQESKIHRINLRKNANTNTRDFILVQSLWSTSVLKQPAWDFSYPDFDTPQNQFLVHHLTKQPLPNLYNSSLHQKTATLWMITMNFITLNLVHYCKQGLL